MNFDFSEEQLLLKSEARRFLENSCDLSLVRTVLDDDSTSYHAQLWRSIADLGWTSTVIPEEYGGLGLTAVELCAIAEELGRSIAPIPFSSTAYLFTHALLIAGSQEQKSRLLPKIATGEIIGCCAIAESPGETPIKTNYRASGLKGIKMPVTDGDIAQYAVVLATDSNGESLFLIDLSSPNIQREKLKILDPTRSAAKIVFSGVEAEPLGPSGKGRELKELIYDQCAIYTAFEQIGGTDAVLDLAKNYALERYAFGRPIGSFQAIKHRLAQMYIHSQLARSHAYYGAWALASKSEKLPLAASAAIVSASKAYWFASKECIEIFGGLGATWEADCHLFYRRGKQLSLMLGQPTYWRERLVSALEQ